MCVTVRVIVCVMCVCDCVCDLCVCMYSINKVLGMASKNWHVSLLLQTLLYAFPCGRQQTKSPAAPTT